MQQQQQKSKTKRNNEVKISKKQKLDEECIYLKNFSKKQGKCLGNKMYSSSLSKNLRQALATKTNDSNQQQFLKEGLAESCGKHQENVEWLLPKLYFTKKFSYKTAN